MDFILPTLGLWIISALVVTPLTKLSVNARRRREGLVATGAAQPVPEDWESVAKTHYIAWDVLVLGVFGLTAGLMFGSPFIGISTKLKGWPGMIAFIGASFVGSALHGR